LVANYPPDVAYAWWLMEYFWKCVDKRLLGQGAQTFLAYPKITVVPESITQSNITTVELEVDLADEAKFNKVRAFIKDNNIQVIYFTDRSFYDKNYTKLREAGVKKIVVHDHTPGDRPRVNGLKRALKKLRNLYGRYTADFFINVSPLMTCRSIESGCISKNKCLTVQNGIESVKLDASKRSNIRESLAMSEDDIVIVTSGRIHPYKQVGLIVEAFSKAVSIIENKQVHLLIVGDGPDFDAINARIDDLGLRERIHLLGFRSDIRDILQASDIAIHAAKGEGFSLSITEYMSSGLPVIVPDTPSVCQAIEPQQQGVIFKQGSVQSAADCIVELVTNKQLVQRMGAKAKEKADMNYSLDVCSADFSAALDKIFN
jgi:glycosyltransferase involved in cell wall biosynthesis